MRLKVLIKGLVCMLSVVALTACSNNATIEGSWVEPVPGMPQMEQGFTLLGDGSATSINMATLQYEKWEQKDNLLILSGNSIGNHQTISFSDTLIIEKMTQNDLTLKENNMGSRTYTKKEVR